MRKMDEMRTKERDGDKTGVRERKRKQLYSIHFDDFNSGGFFPFFFSAASKALDSVYLANNSHTFPMTTEQGAVG